MDTTTDLARIDDPERTTGTATRKRSSTLSARRARAFRLVLAALIAGAGLIGIAPSAGASTTPYAAAGSVSCVNGSTAGAGSFTASNPSRLYPANPTLARSWPGELDYWWIDLQQYTSTGWKTVARGSQWGQTYASYDYMPARGDGQRWDIYASGYYRAAYTIYWSPTGQMSSPIYSSYCYVNKPTATGPWSMW